MNWLAIIQQEGFLPHKESFGYHAGLLAWYEVACWVAMFAWAINTFIALKMQSRIPAIAWVMVRPLCYLIIGLVSLSVLRWGLNGLVLHVPWYYLQTLIYLIDAHFGIGLATLGFWYLVRKKKNIFDRMAKHKENSERWTTVTNSLRLTGIAEFDEGGNIWFANPAMHRIFGYEYGELLGEKITILMPERFRAKHLAGINRFLETGKSYIMEAMTPLELHGVHKDGSEFPIELTLSCYKIEGAPYRFVAIMRDISYRKQLEKALDEPIPKTNANSTA